MSKTPAMLRPFFKYAEFSGRSNRAEFWLFLLLMYLFLAVLAAFVIGSAYRNGRIDTDQALFAYLRWSPVYSLINLAMLVPYLAVAVRRLHDTGRSGWWLVMPVAVSVVAYVVAFAVNGPQIISLMMNMVSQMPTDPALTANPLTVLKLEWPIFELMLPWVAIPSALAQIVVYILCALPGTPGPNRFGVSPT
ncbi:DUF805 domain-containing protein [Asticcacaulis sp. 201]|uniref:DUF805 domain-containing protein n=1 Tax=Asticcacaulis sp. 201 TaxID=3028787 RepID=UPI0029161A6C|nr:DUF805 domain-containing protein [Asticcacaulis sp. 201]MDV6329776.1 DUF805 domain-containing protein [Asticcacaulis sp. 201]